MSEGIEGIRPVQPVSEIVKPGDRRPGQGESGSKKPKHREEKPGELPSGLPDSNKGTIIDRRI